MLEIMEQKNLMILKTVKVTFNLACFYFKLS